MGSSIKIDLHFPRTVVLKYSFLVIARRSNKEFNENMPPVYFSCDLRIINTWYKYKVEQKLFVNYH